jgi:type VI secretion system protein VasD
MSTAPARATRWLRCGVLCVVALTMGACKLIPGKKPPVAPPGQQQQQQVEKPPPPPPKPVPVSLMVQTSATVNPGENGRPLPVVVRLYQLKNDGAFKAASYDLLYKDDQGALGSDLADKPTAVTLRASDQTVITLMVSHDVRFIGIVAFYRQYDNGTQWKLPIPVPVNGGTVMVDKSAVSFTAR